jgi:hypothetical protein
MKNYFQVKVKYTKQLDNGSFKRISEIYLVKAVSFTDAEAIIYENIGSLVKGEFIINSIQKVDYHDLIVDEANICESFFKAKISFASMNEDSEKTKTVTNKYLVNSESVEDANNKIVNHFSMTTFGYGIDSIVSTPIVEIFESTEEIVDDSNDSPFTIEAVVKENESDDSEN